MAVLKLPAAAFEASIGLCGIEMGGRNRHRLAVEPASIGLCGIEIW